MSLRLEEKIHIENLNIFEFKKWLSLNNANMIFSSRIVNSIYFDNNFKMYFDSIEGVVPRKKIRLRTYDTKNFFTNINSLKLEIKMTYFNYRKKIINNFCLSSNFMKQGIFDKDYGNCEPILNIFYKRTYYKKNNFRITLDEEINYSRIHNGYLSKSTFKDNEFVIELKTSNIFDKDNLLKNFPIARSRFSKYCRGVELLKLC